MFIVYFPEHTRSLAQHKFQSLENVMCRWFVRHVFYENAVLTTIVNAADAADAVVVVVVGVDDDG